MSDNYLRLIPTEPAYVPAAEAGRHAERLLRGLLARAAVVRALVEEHVEFVDQGGNFQGVFCPACAADLGEWWPGAMDRASAGRFADLSVVLPCCGAAASLMRYEWPAGFARFVLEAMNPGVPALFAAQIAQLEQLVGCPLRVIRAHY